MITTHKLNMDLQIRGAAPRVPMVQCDVNSRAVEITITAAGEGWVPEGVDTVFLRFAKPDGTGGSYDALPDGTRAWSLEGNVLTILVAPQVLTVAGLVHAQAALLMGEKTLATFGFQIQVEADPSANTVVSEDYINWTAWAKAELDKRLQQAKESGDFSGVTFYPAVDGEGNLTWSNDAGAENPEDVNIVDLLEERLGDDLSLKLSGGTMTGDLVMNGNRVTGLATPAAAADAATKGYVDGRISRQLVILTVEGWMDGMQSAAVPAAAADKVILAVPAPASGRQYAGCGLWIAEQFSGSITFGCETVPETALTISVLVIS